MVVNMTGKRLASSHRSIRKKAITLCLLCLALAAAVLVCGIIGVFGMDGDGVHYKTIPTEREALADDFEELVQESDLIVRAKVLPDKENVFLPDELGEPFGYTVTKLEITGTWKGVQDDRVVTITEEYYTEKDESGTTVWSQGNYLPAREGEEYLFFLKAYEKESTYAGMYFPVDLEKGKYVLKENIGSRPSAKELELKKRKGLSEYRKFYAQAIEAYGGLEGMVTWWEELPEYAEISQVSGEYRLGQAWRDGCAVVLVSPKRTQYLSAAGFQLWPGELLKNASVLYGQELWQFFINKVWYGEEASIRVAYVFASEKERLGDEANVSFLVDLRRRDGKYEAVYREGDETIVKSYRALQGNSTEHWDAVWFFIDEPIKYEEVLDEGSMFSSMFSSSFEQAKRFWLAFFQ